MCFIKNNNIVSRASTQDVWGTCVTMGVACILYSAHFFKLTAVVHGIVLP